MTKKALQKKLENDPNFAISFIIQNNPNAVYNNLRGIGISVTPNPNDIYEKVIKYGSDPQFRECIIKALQVPVLTDELTDEMKDALEDASTTKSLADMGQDAGSGSSRTPYYNDNNTGSSTSNWNWDWLDDFFQAANSGINYLGGTGYMQPGTPEYEAYMREQQAAKQRNTIIVVVVLVAITILGIFLFRKK